MSSIVLAAMYELFKVMSTLHLKYLQKKLQFESGRTTVVYEGHTCYATHTLKFVRFHNDQSFFFFFFCCCIFCSSAKRLGMGSSRVFDFTEVAVKALDIREDALPVRLVLHHDHVVRLQ